MAITRKPTKTIEPKPVKTKKAVDVTALINKGGSAVQTTEKNEEKPVIQRIPEDILKRVDEAVAARRLKTSRNTWINEAILDRLEKEDF